MTMVPETRYARVGDDYVAYQVIGDGPIDLVNISSWVGDVEGQWEYPALARFLERLAAFSRLICYDRRGQGMSDPIDPTDLTLDQWMEDVQAVMDAAGSERAAFLASAEGGQLGIMYAATHPERTSALVLVNARAAGIRQPGYPWGFPLEIVDRTVDLLARSWSKDPSAERDPFALLESDPHELDMIWRLARRSTSPGLSARLWRQSVTMDVRDVLPSVQVPSLVVQRTGNHYTRIGHGRYLAEHLPNVKYVELEGSEHFPWSGDQDEVLDEIEEFLTGVRPAAHSDRVLATVLFTDIVGSTQRAATLGDRRWREVLGSHDAVIAKQLERFDGRKVASVGRGDGVLATFDGPARAVRCARSIVDAVAALGIEVRAGLHTGEIERRGDDVGGIGVHIADRIASLARPCEVLVSRTVVDLVVGSDLTFEERGAHALKGVPNEWPLYAVER